MIRISGSGRRPRNIRNGHRFTHSSTHLLSQPTQKALRGAQYAIRMGEGTVTTAPSSSSPSNAHPSCHGQSRHHTGHLPHLNGPPCHHQPSIPSQTIASCSISITASAHTGTAANSHISVQHASCLGTQCAPAPPKHHHPTRPRKVEEANLWNSSCPIRARNELPNYPISCIQAHWSLAPITYSHGYWPTLSIISVYTHEGT